MAECRKCGRPIVWRTMADGRRWAQDAETGGRHICPVAYRSHMEGTWLGLMHGYDMPVEQK